MEVNGEDLLNSVSNGAAAHGGVQRAGKNHLPHVQLLSELLSVTDRANALYPHLGAGDAAAFLS
jgi:hypothetical protein